MQKLSNINKMYINSISSFININGRFDGVTKDSYFLRYIGYEDEKKYIGEILNADNFMKERINSSIAGYLRLSKLSKDIDYTKYESIYNTYINTKKIENIDSKIPNIILNNLYLKLDYIINICKEINSIDLKQVIIKILYWIDLYFPKIFLKNFDYRISPKFIVSGQIDIYEYLFLYFLVLNGCDVLYLNTQADLNLNNELISLSQLFECKNTGKINIPEYKETLSQNDTNKMDSSNISNNQFSQNGNLKIKLDLTRPNRKKSNTQTKNSDMHNNQNTQNQTNNQRPINLGQNQNTNIGNKEDVNQTQNVKINLSRNVSKPAKIDSSKKNKEYERRLLDYEELALLSSSVVMIEAYDNNNQRLHTGSGVMIGENGYIITNHHVISKGDVFKIIIENDDNIYMTNSVLKYHQNFDLAIIKIDRKLKPMRLYRQNEKLVRGQKVVAIGSQLGLFNSISDGIISGFRNFEDDMTVIQFTAPTLGGNSGGALLNMYGELIGIIFAGLSENINIAIDYETVYLFAKGFLDY